MIDLSTALPITTPFLRRAFSEGLSRLSANTDLAARMRVNRPFGYGSDRQRGAKWLSGRFEMELRADTIALTNGTQSSLLWILQSETKPGDTVVAERLAYIRFRPLAKSIGLNVAGIDMDDEGIIPAALETACNQFRPKALFCTPTIQNPTLAVMSPGRRQAIARIAQDFDLVLIEDDVLGLLHPNAPQPLYRYAPERSYYLMSISKCVAMGLRLAYVVLPSYRQASDPGDTFVRASWMFPNSLSCELVNRWIETGVINEIVANAHGAIQKRQKLALEVLGTFKPRSADGALHVWLPIAENGIADMMSKQASHRGVMIRPASMFRVDEQPAANALRIAITAPETIDELERGLRVVADLLRAQAQVQP